MTISRFPTTDTARPDATTRGGRDAGAPVNVSRRELVSLLTGACVTGAAAAGGLAVPGAAWAQAAPRKGGVLRVSAPANPSSLDPATGGAGSDHAFLFPIFSTLIEWDYETLKPQPGLAESWSYPDNKTLLLNLRKGVTFHDGAPFDAEAVKFNIERAKTSQRSNIKADLATVERVEIVGPHQVALKLTQADSALPLILSDRAGMMVSPKAAQALGNEHDRKPVGAGPWKFVSWSDNQKIVVTRNDAYWRPGMPYLDGIEFAIIPELNTGLRSLIAKQNDFAYSLQPNQKQVIDRAKGLKSVVGSTLYCQQIYLNFGKGALADVRVRRALNHAVDRDTYVKLTMAGLGEAAWMNLPSTHWAYDKSLANCWPHDPELARKLLAEAGHKDGLELSLLGYTDQASVQRQEILIEQFRKAGIRARFTNGSIAEKSAQYFVEKQGDGLLSAWTGRPDPSLSYALMYMKNAYFNASQLEASPELTAALLASRSLDDLEGRKRALAKVQKIVTDLALVVPLAFPPELVAMGPNVAGYKPSLLGKPKFDLISLTA
ncbi:MAG: ABC transporter substrate-binding protein [Burkholderiaceae bacterium]